MPCRDMMALEASLESTPTWAVAGVCLVLIFIALLIEHALHLLTSLVRRRKRKTLNQAIYQIKAELRNLGFMSLLLTVAKQPISKICIPKSLGDSLLPCKNAPVTSGLVVEEMDSCERKGKVPLLSAEATQQLQVLIFVMAVFHVLCCLLTLGLGEAKMKRWESWEEETRTLEHQLSHDPRRFKLARQTSFGKRHLKFWSNHHLLLWLACFGRQFTDSVSRADYFALRQGFLRLHLTQNCNFDFHKFLQRSLDQDFVTAVRISDWVWAYVILIIFFSAHGFYNHYWLPLIPLVVLLGIGTKLEVIITRMCLEGKEQATVVPGTVSVEPKNDLFWFGKPQLLLHAIQFILVQNSFQLAFFAWTWYKFGLRSCFHKETEDIVLSFGIGIIVQFLCAYVTLPLYALVTQMGSSMRKTIFTDTVVRGLRNWHELAKKNLSMKASIPSSSLLQPLPCPRAEILSSDAQISAVSRFKFPSGRRELLEIQKVAEEMIECCVNNVPYDGEISFRMWRKQEVISRQGERH